MSNPKQNTKQRRPRRDWHKTVVALLALLMALLMILPMITVVFQTAGAVSQEELQEQINAGKSQAADLNAQIKKLNERSRASRAINPRRWSRKAWWSSRSTPRTKPLPR